MGAGWLLIADSHVTATTKDEFFAMLEEIGKSDYDVMFLGDNLDLWIASHPRYESAFHGKFLEWCSSEKARRRVVFVEGNHEFYLARRHGDCFTECVEDWYREGDVMFVHGDIAQKRCSFHRFFRWFAKNWFGDFVMRWLPGGPWFSRVMKRLLSHEVRKGGSNVPLDEVCLQVLSWSRSLGIRRVVMGHFHLEFHRELDNGVMLDILPDWKTKGEIGVLGGDGTLHVAGWREVLG